MLKSLFDRIPWVADERKRADDQALRAKIADAKASEEQCRASMAQLERDQERERAKNAEKKAAEANQQASQIQKLASSAQRERDEERERAKNAEEKAEKASRQAAEAARQAAEASQQAASIKQEVEQKKEEELQLIKQFRWGAKASPNWSEEEAQRLRKKFQQNIPHTNGHTFLLFGPTSHGKSSVGNGFMAALEDHEFPPIYHHVAQGTESVSRAFKTKIYNQHRIIDMPGIFEGKAIKNEDIRKIVTGQVPWVSRVTTTLETPDDQKSHKDTVECIIIVLRYDMSDLPPELKRQIGVIWNLCGEDVLSCHLVLTHLDVCDPQFKDTANLPNIYKSPKVLKAVENMSKATGIPPYNISFVKNYTTENETDVKSHLQYLRILNFVKVSADQVVEARLTKASMTEYYRKQEENILNKVLKSYGFLLSLGVICIAILIAYLALF